MFLFGMKTMSEALQKLSGEKLRGVMPPRRSRFQVLLRWLLS